MVDDGVDDNFFLFLLFTFVLCFFLFLFFFDFLDLLLDFLWFLFFLSFTFFLAVLFRRCFGRADTSSEGLEESVECRVSVAISQSVDLSPLGKPFSEELTFSTWLSRSSTSALITTRKM